MRIIFVRHGDCKNGKLTQVGRKQAKLVCEDLKYENIGKIFVAPSLRTQETAKIIAKKLKISNVVVDERLKERDKPKDALPSSEEYINKYLNASNVGTNEEGCKQFLERVFSFLDEVKNENFESVLVVSHSSVAYAINTYFTGLPKDNILIWLRLGNCSKICYDFRQKK